MDRMSRNKMFIEMSKLVAERSTCKRAKVGAVIVKNNRVVSMGYVGSPPGEPHCLDEGCIIGESKGCIRTIHAEVNAINHARLYGIDLHGATLYCTLSPCTDCASEIVVSGISKVIFLKPYRLTHGVDFMKNSGVSVMSYWEASEDES